MGRDMTPQLLIFGILGLVTIAIAFTYNKRLVVAGGAGRVTLLEGLFYLFGCTSLVLGWYFNVRYTHADHRSTYISYTKALFSNWASDSAAQDYIMVNLVLLPIWSIIDGYRRTMRVPWIFFVMSLFTSLAFSMAFYLAFVERQIRYNERHGAQSELAASSTA
jgi:Terpene cyclase DEP1